MVKVAFSKLSPLARFGLVKQQHVVLKIFSHHRTHCHKLEMDIFRKLDENGGRASQNNIIAVYGPWALAPRTDGEPPLAEFLKLLVATSPGFKRLEETVEQCYGPSCQYMMMNHCNSLSLRKHLSQSTLSRSEMLALCTDLAKALAFLQPSNSNRVMVHCDIKADNIFVKARRWKQTAFILGDFGMAQEYLAVWKSKGFTPKFYPPEYIYDADSESERMSLDNLTPQQQNICRQFRTPKKIDVYQYGLIIWQALHGGKRPYTDEILQNSLGTVGGSIKDLSGLKVLFARNFTCRPKFAELTESDPLHDIYKPLQDIAGKCWHVDPMKRPNPEQLQNLVGVQLRGEEAQEAEEGVEMRCNIYSYQQTNRFQDDKDDGSLCAGAAQGGVVRVGYPGYSNTDQQEADITSV